MFFLKNGFTEQIWFKVKGSGLRVDIIHKKPFNVKAERLRNSRKGKSGKFANCNWRISRSSANSAVATAELAGRHSLLPALDVVLQASRMKKYHPCLRKHMMWRTSCCRKGGDSFFCPLQLLQITVSVFQISVCFLENLWIQIQNTVFAKRWQMADGSFVFSIQYSVLFWC